MISVIVPVYNAESHLNRCMDSLVNQTYSNIEIILVDDGSTDNSPAMCDKWCENDVRVSVIHQKNQGVSIARNIGLAAAKGKYISFVDSDDWVAPNFLEVLHDAITTHKCDIVECRYIVTDTFDVSSPSETYDIAFFNRNEAMYAHIKGTALYTVVWNKLYKRSVITELFPEGKGHEDLFWTYQTIANSTKCAVINARLYYYYQRKDSFMHSMSVARLDTVEALYCRTKFIEQNFSHYSGLAQHQTIGMCMYYHQLVARTPQLDPDGHFRNNFSLWANDIGVDWKGDKAILLKQRIWLNIYLLLPNFTCWIRNLLKIGC